jgi:hypothetical protein
LYLCRDFAGGGGDIRSDSSPYTASGTAVFTAITAFAAIATAAAVAAFAWKLGRFFGRFEALQLRVRVPVFRLQKVTLGLQKLQLLQVPK